MDIIKAEKLNKSFDSVNKVFSNADFKVSSNKTVLITGPNASGKTTFIKMLSNLVVPDSGIIEILGHTYKKSSSIIKSQLALCFEPERDFYQMLSVIDNIKIYLKLKNSYNKDTLDKAEALLRELNIEKYKNKSFNHCSSGVKRKVSVLRPLLTDYKIIFIDEPDKGLDEKSMEKVLSLIARDVKEKNALCIIASSKNTIKPYAESTFIIENGNLKEIN